MTHSLSTPTLNPSLLVELLTDAPRPLIHAQAELIFLDGQYILHWRDGEQIQYKFLSSAAVRHAFAHSSIDSGWLPPRVVRWGSGDKGEWMIQFLSPQHHTLLFVCDSGDQPMTLTVPMPGLVFAGRGRDYYLWALKARQFNPEAQVYHAPLPNIDAAGRICFGSNAVPSVSGVGILQAWQLFLNSPFNRDYTSGKSRANSTDVRSHLVTLHQQGKKRYPLRDLVPMERGKGISVDQMVQQFLKY